MRSNERGDPCTHPVRPYPNNCCLIRGRQMIRALESGRVVDGKGIRGVFPVEDAVDDAAEGELVVGEEEAQAVDTLPTLTNRLSPRGTITN